MALTSIRTSGDKIEIVNQLLLPHTTEFIEIDTIEQAYDAIKSMKVSDTGSTFSGATNSWNCCRFEVLRRLRRSLP